MAYADANNLVVADLRARHVIALYQYYETDAHIYCGNNTQEYPGNVYSCWLWIYVDYNWFFAYMTSNLWVFAKSSLQFLFASGISLMYLLGTVVSRQYLGSNW